MGRSSDAISEEEIQEDRRRSWFMAGFFFVLFVVCYGGADVLVRFLPWRFRLDSALDAQMPFWPWAAAVYLSLDLMLLALPAWLRTWRRLTPLFCVLVVETLIATLFFLVFPGADSFPAAAPPAGPAGALFAVADWLNLDGNFFPSLHVAYAFTLTWACRPWLRAWQKVVLEVWAWAIAGSTLVLHQHFVLDVVGGLVLAGVVTRWVGRRAARPDFLTAWDIEWLCLENMALFARRHRRYGLIAVILLGASLSSGSNQHSLRHGWRRSRVLRTGFCALQAIDDLLDGDRTSRFAEPLEEVAALLAPLAALSAGENAERPITESQAEPSAARRPGIERLVQAFADDLHHKGGRAALAQAVQLIHNMMEDRRRRLTLRVDDAAQLREHLRETFELSVDLMLLAGDAELRARDVPELISAFGWCSVVRDLREDLASGLINVPRVVVAEATAELRAGPGRDAGSSDAGSSEARLAWLGTAALHQWLAAERRNALAWLEASDRRLAELRDRRGAGALALFARSIRRYTREAS